MKFQVFLLMLLAPAILASQAHGQTSPVNDPLPMVGTGTHGHTFPGVAAPFGMVQLSPDTPIQGWDGCSGYHYSDSSIIGFSHTHLSGTGCACLGDILLTPTVGTIHFDVKGNASPFSHAKEFAKPGDYRVFLDGPKVAAELTATPRCGFHKYTFPATPDANFILDLDHGVGSKTTGNSIIVENDTTISGKRISQGWGGSREVYFVMQFSKPFDAVKLQRNGKIMKADSREGNGRTMKAALHFSTKDGEVIFVKTGISGTGIEGARKNLAVEIPAWDFEGVRAATVSKWKEALDTVDMQSFDPRVRETFYANLYLSCLAPCLFNDVDGTYRGVDHTNHTSASFQNYTTFSLWDTYRAENPLLLLLQPQRINDMMLSLLTEYKELGKHSTPIWPTWGNETGCMIGYHSVAVIVSAYLRGFRGFDAETAYAAMRDTALQETRGLDTYRTLGYCASEPHKSATSRTIEYSFDDWCLAEMADALGHKEDAALFYQRASNYRNLFDRSTQFFRGRKADGTWRYPFAANALVNDEYTEADAWQYAFGAQHDAPGMIALYGGDKGFIQKLDSMFAADSTILTGIPDISGLIGQFSQGDEQCHHVAYLYDYAGAPYKTQQRVRQIMRTLYDDTPAGQCGNDDCGQMSAWYVFSALGFYPMNPDSGIYVIGSPVVTKATVNFDKEFYHGKKFTVIADKNSEKNIYIQSAELDGKPLDRAWLTHDEIIRGSTLHLVMGPKPNPGWGHAMEVRPPATMPADFHYAALPEPSADKSISLPLPIQVICGSETAAGSFIPDPNRCVGPVDHTSATIDVTARNAAPAAVYQSECYGKDVVFSFPVPKKHSYHVRLHFAEVYDNAPGKRLEDIEINNHEVLKNLDIFAAAGGMHKALVEDFEHITPDSHGQIVIHVKSASESPDKSAKINGIEILE